MVLGIYGAGGLGREMLELAKQINDRERRWETFVFVIDGNSDGYVNGIPVLPYDRVIELYRGNLEIAMGIGEPAVRERLYRKLENDHITVPVLIHPDVNIPDTTVIGDGVTIQYGCFVSCNATFEKYVFLQPQVNVGHDDYFKEGAVISGMANLAGNVTIGKYSYIGLSTAIREGISVGDHSIIGMCSAVHRDVGDRVVAMGNPARVMKKNEDNKVFK